MIRRIRFWRWLFRGYVSSIPCPYIHPYTKIHTLTNHNTTPINANQGKINKTDPPRPQRLCNIIMWALFTRALTASPSTTKVFITNTSANFLATAMLGMLVFWEEASGIWWLGAAMMAGGCILVGMRDV